MKMVSVHGPNNVWTHKVEDETAVDIIEAFRTGTVFSYTNKVGEGWLTEEVRFLFNPAMVVAVMVRNE